MFSVHSILFIHITACMISVTRGYNIIVDGESSLGCFNTTDISPTPLSLIDTWSAKILVARATSLSLQHLSKSNRSPFHQYMEFFNIKTSSASVDYHWEKNQIYFSANNSIFRASLDGLAAVKELSPIIDLGPYWPIELAVDWVQDKIYWINWNYCYVEVADLDGSNRKLLFDNIGDCYDLNNIAVDPYKKLLFIATKHTTFRYDIETELMTPLLTKSIEYVEYKVLSIALDRTCQHLYEVGHFKNGTTFLTRGSYYEGYLFETARLSISEGSVGVSSMDFFMGHLYIVNYGFESICSLYKVNPIDWSTTKVPIEEDRESMSIRVVHPFVQRPPRDLCSCSRLLW